jgi:hypothetical protein
MLQQMNIWLPLGFKSDGIMAYADIFIAYLHTKSNTPHVNDSLITAMILKIVFIILNSCF